MHSIHLLGALLLFAGAAWAATVHVQTNSICGALCDGTEANPWPTLLQGVQATASSGGEIVVHPGIYSGDENTNLTITNTGTLLIRSSTRNPADVAVDCAGSATAFRIEDTGPLTLEGVTLRNCTGVALAGTTTICGGAVYLRGVNATFVRTDFVENRVDGDGGAVCIESATLFISQSLLRGNGAAGRGGAFFVRSADVRITNCTFADNNATAGNDVFCLSSKIRIAGLTNLVAPNVNNCASCPITYPNGTAVQSSCPAPSTSSRAVREQSFLFRWLARILAHALSTDQ